MRQSTEAFGRISCPWYARAVCNWNFGVFSLHLVSGSHFLVVWVLLGVQRIALLGRVCGLGAMPGSTGDTCSATVLAFFFLDELYTISTSKWTRILVFFSVLTQNGEVCSADASIHSLDMRCSHLEIWNYFFEAHVAGSGRDDEWGSRWGQCTGTGPCKLVPGTVVASSRGVHMHIVCRQLASETTTATTSEATVDQVDICRFRLAKVALIRTVLR